MVLRPINWGEGESEVEKNPLMQVMLHKDSKIQGLKLLRNEKRFSSCTIVGFLSKSKGI